MDVLGTAFTYHAVVAANQKFQINPADSQKTRIGKDVGRTVSSVLLAVASLVEYFVLTIPFTILVGWPVFIVKGVPPMVVASRWVSNHSSIYQSFRGIIFRPLRDLVVPPIDIEAIPLLPVPAPAA